jgi:hypothetical protein
MESDCQSKAYLYAGSVRLEGVDDGHVCLEVGVKKLEEGSVGSCKRL